MKLRLQQTIADRLQLYSLSREFNWALPCEKVRGITELIQETRRVMLYLKSMGHEGCRYQGCSELPVRVVG
jgi:hypothetical protein